jgi:hypothetical protein
MLAGSAAGELVNWVETVNKLLFVHLKIISHFGTPCIYCSARGRSRRGRSKPACTLLRLPAGRSYRETIIDGAGNTFTPKTILKLNLLLILYLKV